MALLDFFRFFNPKGPLQCFCCFATEWMLKNPKGSPLSFFFGIVRLLKNSGDVEGNTWHFHVLLLLEKRVENKKTCFFKNKKTVVIPKKYVEKPNLGFYERFLQKIHFMYPINSQVSH